MAVPQCGTLARDAQATGMYQYHEHEQVLAQGPDDGGVRNQYDNEVGALEVS